MFVVVVVVLGYGDHPSSPNSSFMDEFHSWISLQTWELYFCFINLFFFFFFVFFCLWAFWNALGWIGWWPNT
jgi:hypothetical protein